MPVEWTIASNGCSGPQPIEESPVERFGDVPDRHLIAQRHVAAHLDLFCVAAMSFQDPAPSSALDGLSLYPCKIITGRGMLPSLRTLRIRR
jgi:hypothetical protein